MSRESRIKLISEIEESRGSNIVVYFTGDRQPTGSRIAEDAVLPLYRHLLALSGAAPVEKLDLFIYSRGGDVSVPWRVVTMIREFCEEFHVLIPYKAHSAATMISLGADRIAMGKKAELSPIDPSLVRAITGEGVVVPPPEISVEDVSSYVSFMRERANINDQAALAQVVSQLANHLTPLVLGSVNRQYSHIRLIARKLLTSRKEKMDEDRIGTIIEALTEKMYSHGHAIGRQEASELGLPIDEPEDTLETLIWRLYQEYETLLKLDEPIDPEELLTTTGEDKCLMEDMLLAVIESVHGLDVFEANAIWRRKRQIPPNPQININLSFGLPSGIDPTQLPADFQQIIQQILGQISQQIPQIVQQEIVRQSPDIGIEGKVYGGKWIKKTE